MLRLDNGLSGSQMAALVDASLPRTLQSLQLGTNSTHPSVISQCCLFGGLRVLNLSSNSSCFRDEHDFDECPDPRVQDFDDHEDIEYWSQMEPMEANGEALHNV